MTEVVTAVGHRWESAVATTIERVPGVTIARRCADVSELLSVVEAGVGRVAVVSVDLRGLDLGVVGRLRACGVRVVGLTPPDDESADRRLRQLSLTHVLPTDATVEALAEAITGADPTGARDPFERVDGGARPGAVDTSPDAALAQALADSGAERSLPTSATPRTTEASASSDDSEISGWSPAGGEVALDPDPEANGPSAPARALVIAVWGPTGGPGRTTIATTLAAELASRACEVLLVDADTYGGCVAQSLGLLDEAPGIAAACRAADQGTLDVPALARLAPTAMPRLRVLTGLPKADRWPEVRAAALERVLELSRALVPVVVVDCGFCLETDEELSYDTAAPRRNEATLTSLANADVVVAVSGADPIALQRFVRGLQQLGSVPSPQPVVVVNRVRSTAVGKGPESRIADSLLRFAGLEQVRFVPDEPALVDAAVLAGRSLVEHAPDSAIRKAVADLASALAPWTMSRAAQRTRRWGRRQGAKRMVSPANV